MISYNELELRHVLADTYEKIYTGEKGASIRGGSNHSIPVPAALEAMRAILYKAACEFQVNTIAANKLPTPREISDYEILCALAGPVSEVPKGERT